jgi:uncharacterized protein (DUF1800 family)
MTPFTALRRRAAMQVLIGKLIRITLVALAIINAQSIGPESRAGERQHRGLNDLRRDPPGFLLRPFADEPGEKALMGRRFPAGEQGDIAALAWLAEHPATCRHLAAKLACHFVADQPPDAVVTRLARVLQDTRGGLKAMSLELVRLDETWTPLAKLRTPAEYVVAVLRALDLPADKRPNVAGILSGLGRPFFSAAPNGWPDTAADWAGPEAILRRIDWAYSVSARTGALDPTEVAGESLGPLVAVLTLEQIQRAGSRREAFSLLFASPEFMRR